MFCVGKIFERAGEYDEAVACYEEALRQPLDREHRAETLVRLGAIHKRVRFWEGALSAWERLVDHGGTSALFALVEMAKYHEHVERDYESALDAVRQAMTLAELHHASIGADEWADLEHRLGRLLNRLAAGRGR
jgi:tetratricopeptide (TPR) repeat protein